MQQLLRRLALPAVIAVVTLSFTQTAFADVRTEARRHFRRGMQLIADGSLDEGIEELELAYETLPHPNVLYNIGRAYAEAGRYQDALEYFERYLASDPPDREDVIGFIDAIEARLAATQPEPTETAPEPTEAQPEPIVETNVSDEEIVAIEESATQIEALAEATQSDALRERAARLRQLAANLRERSEALAAQEAAAAEAAGGGEETGGELELGAQRTEVFEEEVVSASRFAESPLDAPNSTHIITRQDIRLTGLTDISALLRRVAGVEVMQHYPGHTDVNIRGLGQRQSNKTLFLVDGRMTRLDFLGMSWVQMLPISVEDIERIEVIRGPAAAVYGADAFSGIVNIILREPGENENYVRGSGGSQAFGRLAASVSGRTENFGMRISGGYQRMDHFENLIDPERVDYGTADIVSDPELGIERLWFNGDLRFRVGDGFVIRAGAAVNQGDGTIQGISRLRQTQAQNSVFSQSYLSITTPVGIGLRTYWNRFSTDVDGFEEPPGALPTVGDLRQDIVDTELNFNRQFELGIPQNLSMGVGYRFKDVEWDWMNDDQTEHHFFGYLQDALQLHETLRLTLNVRIDRHPLLDGVQFSPRGSIVWRFIEGNSLRFTGGTAFRSPAFLESYLEFENRTPLRGVTTIGQGNQDLDPERIISFELGYMNQATDFFALEANVYYNLVFDQIQLAAIDTFTLQDWGSGAIEYDEGKEAFAVGNLQFDNENATFRQIGGELGVRVFPVDGLDIYANYAYHDTEPTDQSDFQETPVRGQDERTSAHKINAGIQYRSPIGLDFNIDVHWVSDQVWVEQVTDATRGVGFQQFPLDGYTLLNARVGLRLFDDKLELGITGTNLTFQRVRQHPFSVPVDTRIIGSGIFRF